MKEEKEAARFLASQIVCDSVDFRGDWIKKNNWVVVPVESGSHIDEPSALVLSNAFNESKYSSCLGIATEDVGEDYDCYRIHASKEGFLEFSWIRGSFNFGIIAPSGAVAVLLTVEDYCLVGGDRHFVSTAVGGNILGARKRFLDFAEGHDEMESVRNFLVSVARRYETLDNC